MYLQQVHTQFEEFHACTRVTHQSWVQPHTPGSLKCDVCTALACRFVVCLDVAVVVWHHRSTKWDAAVWLPLLITGPNLSLAARSVESACKCLGAIVCLGHVTTKWPLLPPFSAHLHTQVPHRGSSSLKKSKTIGASACGELPTGENSNLFGLWKELMTCSVFAAVRCLWKLPNCTSSQVKRLCSKELGLKRRKSFKICQTTTFMFSDTHTHRQIYISTIMSAVSQLSFGKRSGFKIMTSASTFSKMYRLNVESNKRSGNQTALCKWVKMYNSSHTLRYITQPISTSTK